VLHGLSDVIWNHTLEHETFTSDITISAFSVKWNTCKRIGEIKIMFSNCVVFGLAARLFYIECWKHQNWTQRSTSSSSVIRSDLLCCFEFCKAYLSFIRCFSLQSSFCCNQLKWDYWNQRKKIVSTRNDEVLLFLSLAFILETLMYELFE
jgi:hypothetical protein